jgi:hypothetical protein
VTAFILARVMHTGGAVHYVARTPGGGSGGRGYTTNPVGVRRVPYEVAAAFVSDMTVAGATFAVINPFDRKPVFKSDGWDFGVVNG